MKKAVVVLSMVLVASLVIAQEMPKPTEIDTDDPQIEKAAAIDLWFAMELFNEYDTDDHMQYNERLNAIVEEEDRNYGVNTSGV